MDRLQVPFLDDESGSAPSQRFVTFASQGVAQEQPSGTRRSPLLVPSNGSRSTRSEPPPGSIPEYFLEDGLQDREEEEIGRRFIAVSPQRKLMRWRQAMPLETRHTLRRQRPRVLFAPPGWGAVQGLSFPHTPDCVHCGKTLKQSEARHGTGLCGDCYISVPKDCSVCKRSLPLKTFQWGSGLCKSCYDACEKQCWICKDDLSRGSEQNWRTGLCDKCAVRKVTKCRLCDAALKPNQLAGLCDPCYNAAEKDCICCGSRMETGALRWGTGLCNNCYDQCEKTCGGCQSKIPLGSLHWRSGLCDNCYDVKSKLNLRTCMHCTKALPSVDDTTLATGLCRACYEVCLKTCKKCTVEIGAREIHWGSGLCDLCYNHCEKICKKCTKRMPLGQLHWNSGLCDECYAAAEKQCRKCQSTIPLGQLHWGTRLCDTCFDKCEKVCRSCSSHIDLGFLQWGTGLCDKCYDRGKHKSTSLQPGVLAAIWTQLVFYMAPGALQPMLFLQIRAAGYLPGANSVYAAVLTTASLTAMVAPIPLGMWAERRGERDVYVGSTLAAAVGCFLLAVWPPSVVFALAWAALNMPPAVRGVRAAYFARHVPPEELSRAGQLASSAGLIGGFLGPLLSVACSQIFYSDSIDEAPGGFVLAAIFGGISCVVCAFALFWFVPPNRKRLGRTASFSDEMEQCERCLETLQEEERRWATALCDRCYNNFSFDHRSGKQYSFGRFCRRVLTAFCIVAALLEVSMNAGVIAVFQPLAVSHFGWGTESIAAVNFAGAGLSVIISLITAHLRLPERLQMAGAAGLYVSGVLVFATPPLSEWRLVLGLMLGIKAQILFMAPFTAIFSRLIGRARVTNRLTTALCLAPAIGAAVGTAFGPACLMVAGTPSFVLVSLPALAAVAIIAAGWSFLKQDNSPGCKVFHDAHSSRKW